MAVYNIGSTTTSKKDLKTKKYKKIHSIIDIDFQDGVFLYVFPGDITDNDLLIKFKNSNIRRTNIRQPSHVHWSVDMLIKKENNEQLVNRFLNAMLVKWDDIKPLLNREFHTIIKNLSISKNTKFKNLYENLNNYGYFKMEFLIHLMELLMLQEKTNYPDAYKFKEVVNLIQNSNDLYAIISKASYTGR